MKKLLFILSLLILASCQENQQAAKTVEIEENPRQVNNQKEDLAKIEAQLKKDGYQTFSYKDGDTTYLMQQYYIVFLKSGPTRSQDSTEAAELQKQHLAHLSRMYEEGYTSLTGPMGDDGDLRGIVIYNTPTMEEADSLAKLDPMVKAGRLIVEVHPWWVAKGGKLK